jgi:sirohydrochlorin cobaltochelatase
MNPTTGLLLFAHGARDPNWARPFTEVAARARAARPDVQVRMAFLEFMAPDLVAAGDELAAAGCVRVDVVPLFLGAGGHVRKDLPMILDKLRTAHPGVLWNLRTTVGEQPEVIAALARAAVAALEP